MPSNTCDLPWKWFSLQINGDVTPCSYNSYPIGNIYKNNLTNIWNGTAVKDIRKFILMGKVHPRCLSGSCEYVNRKLYANNSFYINLFKIASDCLTNISLRYDDCVANEDPTRLVVATTTRCNMKCVMCPQGNNAISNGIDLKSESIDLLYPYILNNPDILLVSEGETLLAESFWKMLDCIKDNENARVITYSNGLLLTPSNIDRIITSNLSEISISLDAASAETYFKVRNSNFELITNSITEMCKLKKKRKSKKPLISINMTLMQCNICEASAFVELGAKLGVDKVVFSQLVDTFSINNWKNKINTDFQYNDQFIKNVPETAKLEICKAQKTAKEINVEIEYLYNTNQYANYNGNSDVPHNSYLCDDKCNKFHKFLITKMSILTKFIRLLLINYRELIVK